MPRKSKLVDVSVKTPQDSTCYETSLSGQYRDNGFSSSSFNGLKSTAAVNLSTLKTELSTEDNFAKLTTEGPGVGGELGGKWDTRSGPELGAMLEARAAEVKGELGPVFAKVGLNANTGVRLGGGGIQASVLGFGLNLGVGGRFSVDTPVGSLGASTLTNTHTRQNEQRMYAD